MAWSRERGWPVMGSEMPALARPAGSLVGPGPAVTNSIRFPVRISSALCGAAPWQSVLSPLMAEFPFFPAASLLWPFTGSLLVTAGF